MNEVMKVGFHDGMGVLIRSGRDNRGLSKKSCEMAVAYKPREEASE